MVLLAYNLPTHSFRTGPSVRIKGSTKREGSNRHIEYKVLWNDLAFAH